MQVNFNGIDMKTIEKTLKYYELLMIYDDTSKYLEYPLPADYHISFYQKDDEDLG